MGSSAALEVVKAALGTTQLPAEVLIAHGLPSAPIFVAVTVAGSGGRVLEEAAVKVALPTAAKRTDVKARVRMHRLPPNAGSAGSPHLCALNFFSYEILGMGSCRTYRRR